MIEKIIRTMEERSLFQRDVEKACHLSHGRISKWKDGIGQPNATELMRIADLLQVPMRYLADDRVKSPDPEISHDEVVILELVRALGLAREEAVKRLVQPQSTEKPLPAKEQKGAGLVVDSVYTEQQRAEPPIKPRGKRMG